VTLPAGLADLVHPDHRATSALVTDYDGTIAPIVDDPRRATALPEAIDALRVLAVHLGLVGVISGRPVSFLREKVAVDGAVLVGQYGLERWTEGGVVVDPRAEPYVDAVARAAVAAEHRWHALRVERKGAISCTVHWRTAPEYAPDLDELAALAAEHGLAMQPGRMACELRPPVPVDKGTTFAELAGGFSHRAFAGDDHGDLAVFDQEAPDAGSSFVRIAVESDESPAELLQKADVVVEGPRGLASLLTEMADSISRPSPL
jgi:trehalose 6-phosphate phosphatase